MKGLKKLQIGLVAVLMVTCSIFVMGCGKNDEDKDSENPVPPVECNTFVDSDKDSKCDTCGKGESAHTPATGPQTPVECNTFVDSDKDNKCDTCGKAESEHTPDESTTGNGGWTPWY